MAKVGGWASAGKQNQIKNFQGNKYHYISGFQAVNIQMDIHFIEKKKTSLLKRKKIPKHK